MLYIIKKKDCSKENGDNLQYQVRNDIISYQNSKGGSNTYHNEIYQRGDRGFFKIPFKGTISNVEVVDSQNQRLLNPKGMSDLMLKFNNDFGQ